MNGNDSGIAEARDRLRERAQNEYTSIALSDLLRQAQKEITRLREENERLRKNTFLWRDIATAPKDGTEVFLMRLDAAGVAAIGAGCWGRRADGSCDEWIAFNRHQRFPQTPTHWMPLPPEPTP